MTTCNYFIELSSCTLDKQIQCEFSLVYLNLAIYLHVRLPANQIVYCHSEQGLTVICTMECFLPVHRGLRTCNSKQQLEDAPFCLKVFVTPTPSSLCELPCCCFSLSVYFLLCILNRSPPINTQFSHGTVTKLKPLDWPTLPIISILHPLLHLPFLSPLGECVLQRAVMVRKKLTAREGRGWLSGTLFCTHFRVAFVPQDSPKPDVSPSEQL